MTADHIVKSRLEEETVVPWTVSIIDISLQYWPNDNVITDANGKIVYNVFEMITPDDLLLFKENPYWTMYFTHHKNKNMVVGIQYKDPYYFEEGDYKRYPTMSSQRLLREQELAHFGDHWDEELQMDFLRPSNFKFRRKLYPELYI